MSKNILIVRLIGGLGNQLFQLQFASNILYKNKRTLKLDVSYLEKSSKSHEKLAISKLKIDAPIIKLSWFDLKIRRLFERLMFKLNLKKSNFLFPIFLFENWSCMPSKKKIIIEGFWQDKKYINLNFIQKLRNVIKEFRINNHSGNHVCVHIRRGDYLTNRSWFVRQQIVLPISYYLKSFDYFRKTIDQPVFEVYSDDETWAKNAFKDMTDVIIVPSSFLEPFNLLIKMSSYRNYVIANSTLSWWAAVASEEHIEKKVLLPNIWNKNISGEVFKLEGWVDIECS